MSNTSIRDEIAEAIDSTFTSIEDFNAERAAGAVIAKLRETDRLIDRGRIFKVLETDRTDFSSEDQTFTVYTQPTPEVGDDD